MHFKCTSFKGDVTTTRPTNSGTLFTHDWSGLEVVTNTPKPHHQWCILHTLMSRCSCWHRKSTFISPTQAAAHAKSTVLASVGLPIGALLCQHNLPRPCGGMILVGRNQFQSLQCITMMGIGCNKPVSI